MDMKTILAALKKNAMLVVMILVYVFFMILTGGGIFTPSSFTELINQNAYVYILGAGMLMCMLTGGNIDLSCGAFVCLLGAIGGVFMIVNGFCKEVFKELPMEFAVEAQNLLGVSLEGSVG